MPALRDTARLTDRNQRDNRLAANLPCIGCNQTSRPSQGRNPGCHRHNRSPAIGGGNPYPVRIHNCARHDCKQAGRSYCRCLRHNDPHPGVRFSPSSHLFGGNRLITYPRVPRRACRTADKIPLESLGRVTGLPLPTTAWRLPQRGRTYQQLGSYSLLPPLDVLVIGTVGSWHNSDPVRLPTVKDISRFSFFLSTTTPLPALQATTPPFRFAEELWHPKQHWRTDAGVPAGRCCGIVRSSDLGTFRRY
jgi:hypothetical protein